MINLIALLSLNNYFVFNYSYLLEPVKTNNKGEGIVTIKLSLN